MTTPPPAFIKWPEKCWAAVVRGGEQDACDKPAVAVAVSTEEDTYWEDRTYPVCKNHARGREMLPLTEIIRITKETSK